MNEFFTPDQFAAFGERLWTWLSANVLVLSTAVQLVVIAATWGIAMLLSRKLLPRLAAHRDRPGWGKPVAALMTVLLPLLWLSMLWLASLTAGEMRWPHHVLKIGASLLSAWVIISLVSRLARDPLWAKTIAWTAWSIAALNILNLVEPTIAVLDSAAVSVGELRISLYTVVQSALALTVLLSVALYVSRMLESRIRTSRALSPSVQVLFSKSLKIVFVSFAVLIAVRVVGIDLTALTVVGAALGLGAGFGLQKIVGNLVSGVILLMDKSIKPGDVIAVGGTYGWVTALGGRYVSIVTRDGIEHLIPNESMITQPVENWTHSNSVTRLKAPVAVHYKSDVKVAMELCLAAAAETERVLTDPDPRCLLIGFGERALDLELRFWINDAHNGVNNVRSDVQLRIWEKFREHGIVIPYPQLDLHIRSSVTPLDADAAPQAG